MLQPGLVIYTVILPKETVMPSTYRQHYQPKPNRIPAWLRRIWLLF